jgi:hypothetical protein
MTAYLHNNCEKVTQKLRKDQKLRKEYCFIQVTPRGSLSLVIGWHTIKILRCPYCGRTGKEVLKYEKA